MKTNAMSAAPNEDISAEASAVHAWRVKQLTRLGLAWSAADAIADRIDWHAVAALVCRGCPVSLAVAILD
jgi:hypothetical protein